VTRVDGIIAAMPNNGTLPQDQQSRDKINTAVATNLIENRVIDANGRGSPQAQAAMGTGPSSGTVYVISDPNAVNPRVVPTDIGVAQNTSMQALTANLTAVSNTSQQPPVVEQKTPPAVEQPTVPLGRSQ
jgi:hypothetical protein